MDNGTVAQRTGEEQFLSCLKSFNEYYTQLVCFAFGAIAVAIAIAFFSGILWGIAIAAIVVAVYVYFPTDEAKKQLGIFYTNTQGHIRIDRAKRVFDGCIVIPQRLIYADVTEIGDGALAKADDSLERVYIPVSIEHIGKDIFGKAREGVTVHYEGSAEQWESVEKLTDLSSYSVVFECKFPVIPPKKTKPKKSSRTKKKEGKE